MRFGEVPGKISSARQIYVGRTRDLPASLEAKDVHFTNSKLLWLPIVYELNSKLYKRISRMISLSSNSLQTIASARKLYNEQQTSSTHDFTTRKHEKRRKYF